MQANQVHLLDFIRTSPQFIIPIYQRMYSWTTEECKQLLSDVIEVGGCKEAETHFVGAIVHIGDTTNPSTSLVIDGQQRLTTTTLLLAALEQALEGDEEPFEGFSASKIRNRYLIDSDERGERHYKLLLGKTDKDTLTAIVSKRELPQTASIRIEKNFNFFKKQIGKHKQKAEEISRICRGLAKLMVVQIGLNHKDDDPQAIFESMNSKGMALTQTDLIRNFMLMNLEHNDQKDIYENYWHPMEAAFGQENYEKYFNVFMRHYLTCQDKMPKKDMVYEEFKRYADKQRAGEDILPLVKRIKAYAGYYCAIALDKEGDPEIKRSLSDFRSLKSEVADPFLLKLYHDYKNHIISKSILIETIHMIESYIFRRAVCGYHAQGLNKMFAAFKNHIDESGESGYLESIKTHFLGLSTYLQFPSDDNFRENIKICDLYKFGGCDYWLFRVENFQRPKERISAGKEYTVEHIMPQKLTPKWEEELGSDAQKIHDTMINRLGNLTLTGHNPEYGNKPFVEKRDGPNGFKYSPLKLNESLKSVEKWNAVAIQNRSDELAELALKVWPAPVR